MTVVDISRAIISGKLTYAELDTIGQALAFARAQLSKHNTGSLVVGTHVKFTNTRTRQVIMGTVEKVNRKFIIVKSGMTNWKVPAPMLERA